jgi:hypothetical protein
MPRKQDVKHESKYKRENCRTKTLKKLHNPKSISQLDNNKNKTRIGIQESRCYAQST